MKQKGKGRSDFLFRSEVFLIRIHSPKQSSHFDCDSAAGHFFLEITLIQTALESVKVDYFLCAVLVINGLTVDLADGSGSTGASQHCGPLAV